jgi:NADH-quinone oxidoreductase subunit N
MEVFILFTDKIVNYGIDSVFWLIIPDISLLYLIMAFLWFFVINNNDKESDTHLMAGLSCCVSLFISLVYIVNLHNIVDINSTYYLMNGMIEITPIVLVTKFVLTLVALLVLTVMTFENRINYKVSREIFLIILISLFGMFILIESNNLFLIYICMELQSIALYILSSIKPYSNKSIEAGLKYFIYGSFMSVVFLLGVSLLYGLVGSLDLNDIILFISISESNELVMNFTLICILTVFLFKLALFPFNWWIDDVYAGSMDLIVFFFAIVPKLAVFMVFIKLYFSLFIFFPIVKLIIFISSFLSVVIATI